MELYYTYPNWKRKALSFTFDDGNLKDKPLVNFLNENGLKGTFNLAPKRFSEKSNISRSDLPTLYIGHEVASHGCDHLHLIDLSERELQDELRDGRSQLEDILGRPVLGYASAFGEHTKRTVEAMESVGFAYARTASWTGRSLLPNDFMRLNPSCALHNFGDTAEKFIKNTLWGGTLSFLNCFGHSYEFKDEQIWENFTNTALTLANNKDIWYTTNIDIISYITALRSVSVSLDGFLIENRSSIPIYGNFGESHGTQNVKQVIIEPGKLVDLRTLAPSDTSTKISIASNAPKKIHGHFDLAYPDWKRKALTFSYDDGPAGDRRLLEILNKYNLKGTFNLNTHEKDKVSPPAINSNEYKELYKGHEIALHGARHETFASVPYPVIVEDIYRNRLDLERLLSKPVRGFAYPNGDSSKTEEGDRILKALGVAYGRAVIPPVRQFQLPGDFLDWHPTAHHNAKIMEIGKAFLEARNCSMPLLCYIWGHTFEFDYQNNWNVIEDFARLMAGNDAIWYATNIEIYDYISAARSLKWSLKKDTVFNPSSQTIYGFVDDKPIKIEPTEIK